MPNYRRMRVEGGTYFFTVNLADRRRRLLTDRIDLLRRAVQRVRAHHPFEIDACVVLPDHLHCIWTLPSGDHAYSQRWRLVKFLVTEALPGERGIWQPRFWEHTIRDDRDFRQHVDYLHFNPVKHRHVTRVTDWPYSTFHRYVREGILPADWGGDVGEMKTVGE
jgi:putative transposase